MRLRKMWLWALAGGVVLGVWLYFTPPGLLGKADAVASAVCSRDPAHSPFLGARQMPLCYRDTGMHLGILLTLIVLAWGRRGAAYAGFPRGKMRWGLGLLAGAFVLDGLNSFAEAATGWALYPPTNALRLATGLGMGIGVGALFFAAFYQTAWHAWQDEPALTPARFLGALGAAAVGGALVLSGNPLVLYPVALLTTADVVLLLSLIYALFALGFMRRLNRVRRWQEMADALLIGSVFAWVQIGVMNWMRLVMLHVWGAFALSK